VEQVLLAKDVLEAFFPHFRSQTARIQNEIRLLDFRIGTPYQVFRDDLTTAGKSNLRTVGRNTTATTTEPSTPPRDYRAN
jgi:hypothetical protein